MASNGRSNDQQIPFNATTILAVLTLLGGVLLATHKLSSDRPVALSGEANPGISEEKVDTRLWEDPFGRIGEAGRTNWPLVGNLAGEMEDPRNTNFEVLAIMIPGGPASEDRETRIRDRFAIVSALAESAYVPIHDAQIGMGYMPWPSTLILSTNVADKSMTNHNLVTFAHQPFTNRMNFAFEWYDRELFHPYRPRFSTNQEGRVLVLWLDEDQFKDFPIPRLDLFFRNLGDTNLFIITNRGAYYTNEPDLSEGWLRNNVESNVPHRIALIGPSGSDTLKAMFAHEFERRDESNNPPPGNDRTNWTTNIDLYLAAPQAVDQVLVKQDQYEENAPRQALLFRLRKVFRDAKNFAVTDSDLAREVINELKLRNVDLADTNCHFVLIGGLDEYYGRMLSAAYAAELTDLQSGGNFDSAKYFEGYLSNQNTAPSNLHTFFYLSGIDGGGLSSNGKGIPDQAGEAPCGSSDNGTGRPTRWTPDETGAQGPAQFDYLTRLASRIDALNDDLLRAGHGSVRAISIDGGDVYDRLLILQALRPRFPDAVFITTKLDARYWDAKEWEWSRNLVVVSGYGLTLNEEFQSQTAPFRDSLQPAMFAVALSALGNTNLPDLSGRFPVRRFEIGRYGPMQLKTDEKDAGPHPLHPPLNVRKGLLEWLRQDDHKTNMLGLLLLVSLLLVALSSRIRRLTILKSDFLAQPLWLREEDIGGLDGFAELARSLARSRRQKDSEEKSEGKKEVSLREQCRATIEKMAKEAEVEMDKALEQQGAACIFTEADILDPGKFIKVLKGDKQTLKEFPSAKGWPKFIKKEYQTAGLLDNWEASKDQTALLTKVVETMRSIIINSKFSSETKRPEEAAVMWRRNRKLLSEWFKGVVRPPPSFRPYLNGDESEEARAAWEELMKDPTRRDFLQTLMLANLQEWNAQWKENPADNRGRHHMQPVGLFDLHQVIEHRDTADKLIEDLLGNGDAGGKPASDVSSSLKKAWAAARAAGSELFNLGLLRWYSLLVIVLLAAGLGFYVLHTQMQDTASGSWRISGASLWPSIWLLFLTSLLGVYFVVESYFQLRTMFFETTRECRLDFDKSRQTQDRLRIWSWWREMFYTSSTEAVIDADHAWQAYQSLGRGAYRFWRTLVLAVLYFFLLWVVYGFAYGHSYQPIYRSPPGTLYVVLSFVAFLVFLFLSFWTVDAAFLCHWFIEWISQGPTNYSPATRLHFSRKRGQVPFHVLSEWIDVSVIAEITERVGNAVYFPACVFLLMLLANNNLFYYFPWSPVHYGMCIANIFLAAASIFILQRAARQARAQSLKVLEQKISQLKSSAAVTEAERKQFDIKETEDLLAEIRDLRKGAFRGFWDNPLLGALLVPSGGTALIEILKYLMK
jgi:hypothetical protein